MKSRFLLLLTGGFLWVGLAFSQGNTVAPPPVAKPGRAAPARPPAPAMPPKAALEASHLSAKPPASQKLVVQKPVSENSAPLPALAKPAAPARPAIKPVAPAPASPLNKPAVPAHPPAPARPAAAS